jgi:hypothetical protein
MPMDRNAHHLEALETAARRWRARIDALESQLDAIEGPSQLTTIRLLNRLKQQHIIVDQYLNLVKREGHTAWRRNADQLTHLLTDIDDTYRRALVYFD